MDGEKPKTFGSRLKKFFVWFVFCLALLAVLVFLLNIQYFSLQFRLLILGQTPAITVPQIPANAPASGQTTEPNMLWIPSLGIIAPIIYVGEAHEKVYQEALASGVVHFPETAEPGEFGNVYIFGHSSDYAWSKGAYKTVFALLTKILPGAEILISNKNGQLFSYKVKEGKVIGANDVQYLSQERYEKKLLTLQTSYPIGTALKRYIVRAELEE